MLIASRVITAIVMTGDAPHKLITEEAGGIVTDLFGNDQRYDRVIKGAIISNSDIHADIVQIAQIYPLNV